MPAEDSEDVVALNGQEEPEMLLNRVILVWGNLESEL